MIGNRRVFIPVLFALSAALNVTFLAPTATAAEADDATFQRSLRFGFAGAAVRPQDNSYQRLDDDVAARGEFTAGATIARGLTLQLEYSLGTSYAYTTAGVEADFHGAGIRARYALECGSFIAPYATLGLGASVAKLQMETSSASNTYFSHSGPVTLNDTATAFHGDVAIGVQFKTRGRIGFGVYQDFGYAFRTPYDFDAATRASGSGSVDLGSVQLHGFQFRMGVFVDVPF